VSEEPAPNVWHSLRCRDSRAEISFLVEAFGFLEAVVIDQDGGVGHAQLDWPEGGGIMLGDEKPGDPISQPPGTGAAYVVSADPAAVHERAVAAGAEIIRPLEETDYGSTDFSARDPEGNVWSFGTYRGTARPDA
jgi:uncharacterized glyoxalase superfamily protein PhnB